jgi:hypothetical protein
VEQDAGAVNIPLTEQQQQTVDILRKHLGLAEKGELLSVMVIAERFDEAYSSEFSRRDNIFGMAGFMIHTALRQMGFKEQ